MNFDSRFDGFLQFLETFLETSCRCFCKRCEIRKHRSCQVFHFFRYRFKFFSFCHEFLYHNKIRRRVNLYPISSRFSFAEKIFNNILILQHILNFELKLFTYENVEVYFIKVKELADTSIHHQRS